MTSDIERRLKALEDKLGKTHVLVTYTDGTQKNLNALTALLEIMDGRVLHTDQPQGSLVYALLNAPPLDEDFPEWRPELNPNRYSKTTDKIIQEYTEALEHDLSLPETEPAKQVGVWPFYG